MENKGVFAGSNMLKRVITGAVLIAIVAGMFVLRQVVGDREVGKKLFDITFYVFSLVGTFEIARAYKDKTTFFEKTVVGVFAAAYVPVLAFLGIKAGMLVLLTSVALIFCDYVLSCRKVTDEGVDCSLISLFYPTVFLTGMYYINHRIGMVVLLLLFFISAFSDTFALFAGLIFKGKKLCPEISPKKTISGAIGGLVGGMIGAIIVWIVVRFVKHGSSINTGLEIAIYLVAGLFGSVATQFGDLVESEIKRRIGIKDFGNVFPGHGGMLDRIDGYIFNSLFLTVYFSFITMLLRAI